MRSLTIGIVLVVLAGFMFMKGCSSYNTFVEKEENVENAWSKVQSAYQRRSDLIGNLVATVKGAAQFEQKTLTDIANARAKATSVNIDPTNLTPEKNGAIPASAIAVVAKPGPPFDGNGKLP